MKKFLFISFHFPPIGGSGTFRQLHFVRHSRRLGWEATVISRRPDKTLPYDERLLAELPPDLRVERARMLELNAPQRLLWRLGWDHAAATLGGFYFSEAAAGWIPDAYRLARKAAQETKFDAVVSVGAPFAAHIIGKWIAEKFDLPWIAEYKDEWADSPYVVFPTALHRRAAQHLENTVVNQADRVLAVTDAFRDRIQARTPVKKVFTLPNGYDERVFAGEEPYQRNAKYTIAYIGSYYGMNSPALLFKALDDLVGSGRIPADKLEFLHVGMGRYDVPPGLQSIVTRKGFVSQGEATRFMQKADLLTQTLPDPSPQSGKAFDYLRAGRPILAITPKNGMLAKLIDDTRTGDVVDPDDRAGVADAVYRRFKDWEAGRNRYAPDRELIRSYEWGNLTEGLIGHLNAAVAVHRKSKKELAHG